MGMLPKIGDEVRLGGDRYQGLLGVVTDEGVRDGVLHYEVVVAGMKLWLPEQIVEVMPPPRKGWDD